MHVGSQMRHQVRLVQRYGGAGAGARGLQRQAHRARAPAPLPSAGLRKRPATQVVRVSKTFTLVK